MAGEYTAVDEHDAVSEVDHTNADGELSRMRERHDELVRRLDSISPRAPSRTEPRQNKGLEASLEALSLEIQPEAEGTGVSVADEEGERSSLWSSTRPAASPRSVVSPTHSDFLLTSIGAKFAAFRFMWAFNVLVNVGFLVGMNTYSDEEKTVLTHVFDICAPVGSAINTVASGLALGRVTAAGGQLALLGAGDTKISARSRRALWRKHAFLVVPFAIYMTLAAVCLFTASRVGTRSTLTGRVITEKYAVAVFFGGWASLVCGLSMWPLWLTLEIASALVADAVLATRHTIERCTPGSAEWELEVVPSILSLCTKTLPLLSDGWGSTIGTAFVGWWLLAIAFFVALMESGSTSSLVLMIVAVLTPLCMVYEAASASEDCDLLSDTLTAKRMNGPNDKDHEHALCRVERILDRQNTKQGLGLAVHGRVLDLTKLGNIVAALFAVATIVVPTLVALRPGGEWDGHTLGTIQASILGQTHAHNDSSPIDSCTCCDRC